WHGLTPALGLSAVILAAGVLIHLGARRTQMWRSLRLRLTAAGTYRRTLAGIDRTAVELTGGTQRGSLPFYLGVILVTLVVLTGGVLIFGGPWPLRIEPFSSPLQLIVGGVIIVAAISAALA